MRRPSFPDGCTFSIDLGHDEADVTMLLFHARTASATMKRRALIRDTPPMARAFLRRQPSSSPTNDGSSTRRSMW